jgi:hypothetical protein
MKRSPQKARRSNKSFFTSFIPAVYRMRSTIFAASLFVSLVAAVPAPAPSPPGVPTASSAVALLAALAVAPQGPQDGYSRAKFPHWIKQSGTCDTRETVLKRDGTDVVTNSACTPKSGSWYSPYDGLTWTASSDVDIDHLVPLSNAWKVRL